MHAEAQKAAHLISVDQIYVPPDRQRKEAGESKTLTELKRGIVSKGLFHPPVLAHRVKPAEGEPNLQLIAGERRLRAIRELHADGLSFMFNGITVPPGFIPYTLLSDLSAADLAEAELEENVLRVQLPWQEEHMAKLKIHELRKAQNPDQSLALTAQEIVQKSAAPQSIATETSLLSMAQTVAPFMEMPLVKNAKSLRRAYAAVLDQQQAKLARDLRLLIPKVKNINVILGDFLEVSKTLPKESFDVIISDPPYGIAAHQQSFEVKHAYDDSRTYALDLYREIFRRGFSLLRPQGTIFLFCDIEHFITIRTFAESMAFSTWRTPVVWHKGLEGPAPWGKNGFQRTYELLLFAVKGQRPLEIGPVPDVHLVKRVNRQDRKHAAEKPPELFRWLLQLSCRPGAHVLDPCAGSGPIVPASAGLGLDLTLVEKSEEYHAALCLRAQEEIEDLTELDTQVDRPFTLGDLDDDIFGDE